MSVYRWCSKIFIILMMSSLALGFRLYPGGFKWNVSTTASTIWVDFCRRPILSKNDLPSEDPLYGQAITFDTAIQSVFDDYTNINSSYLVVKDASTDPTYDASANRTIHVCFGNVAFPKGGTAQTTITGGAIVDCKITILESTADSAKGFIKTLTHEMGHCFFLDHAQDTSKAVMSYFAAANVYRLQMDDKMGIVYQYPMNPDEVKESSTAGLSCAPRN